MNRPKHKTREIADALADAAGPLLGRALERLPAPDFDAIQTVDELRVVVLVGRNRREVLDRSTLRESHDVDVVFVKRVTRREPDTVWAMLDEVEALCLLFAGPDEAEHSDFANAGALFDAELAGANFAALASDEPYDPDLLRTRDVFGAVVTLTFEITR